MYDADYENFKREQEALEDKQNPEAVAGKWTVKDSGKKAEYSSGMRRDTTEGKPKFNLMLPEGVPYEDQLLYRVAMLYMRGGVRYGDRNWEKSCNPEDLAHHTDALWRHFVKFVLDVQDGEDHAAAVVWNVNAVLLTRRNMLRELERADAAAVEDDDIEYEGFDQSLPFQPPGQVQDDLVRDPTGRFWRKQGGTYWRFTQTEPPVGWEEWRCSAHGNEKCEACSQNPDPSRCQCGMFESTGMHWDTCPGRIREFPAHLPRTAETKIHEIHGGDKPCWCGWKPREDFPKFEHTGETVTTEQAVRCPDGGKCNSRRACPAGGPCTRVLSCGPLSGVYPGNRWPDALRQEHFDKDASNRWPGRPDGA